MPTIGRNPRFLKSGEQDEEFYWTQRDTLTRGETWRGLLVNGRKDGTKYTEDAVISPVRDASGRTVNYSAVKRNITDELRITNMSAQAQKMERAYRGIDKYNKLDQVSFGGKQAARLSNEVIPGGVSDRAEADNRVERV